MAAADGGPFAFGDAVFAGSVGGDALGSSTVGAGRSGRPRLPADRHPMEVASPSTRVYRGSMDGVPLNGFVEDVVPSGGR